MQDYNPYAVIKRQHVTEKAMVLQGLKDATSNKSIARFKLPKFVFIVDRDANKQEIAKALEEIYKEKKIRVVAVNTMNVKSQPVTRGRRRGKTAAFKKAIVTLEEGDNIENV